MSFKTFFLFGLFILLITACKKDATTNQLNEEIFGYWANPVYTDTSITYTRAINLPDNEYGFLLQKPHKFIEHKNIGSCGTPPIVYGIYEGTWTQAADTLKIEVGYWGGITSYTWLIQSIDDKYLSIKQIYKK
jgi:hypothetical protein